MHHKTNICLWCQKLNAAYFSLIINNNNNNNNHHHHHHRHHHHHHHLNMYTTGQDSHIFSDRSGAHYKKYPISTYNRVSWFFFFR